MKRDPRPVACEILWLTGTFSDKSNSNFAYCVQFVGCILETNVDCVRLKLSALMRKPKCDIELTAFEGS